ncbi:MAG: isoprenylcysteine carboxylmethyltransferase family protein [Candidatus Sericytochromatia bacterium]
MVLENLKVGTTIMTFDNPEKLVIDGLYKFTRNPMYLGFLIFLIGFFIILGTLTPVFIVFLFFIITDNWYIKFEELKLIDKFGENYLTYKKNVRKWL